MHLYINIYTICLFNIEFKFNQHHMGNSAAPYDLGPLRHRLQSKPCFANLLGEGGLVFIFTKRATIHRFITNE